MVKTAFVNDLLQDSLESFVSHWMHSLREQFPDSSFQPHVQVALDAFIEHLSKHPPSNPHPSFCSTNASFMLAAYIICNGLKNIDDYYASKDEG